MINWNASKFELTKGDSLVLIELYCFTEQRRFPFQFESRLVNLEVAERLKLFLIFYLKYILLHHLRSNYSNRLAITLFCHLFGRHSKWIFFVTTRLSTTHVMSNVSYIFSHEYWLIFWSDRDHKKVSKFCFDT